jgi:hypothetical protein
MRVGPWAPRRAACAVARTPRPSIGHGKLNPSDAAAGISRAALRARRRPDRRSVWPRPHHAHQRGSRRSLAAARAWSPHRGDRLEAWRMRQRSEPRACESSTTDGWLIVNGCYCSVNRIRPGSPDHPLTSRRGAWVRRRARIAVDGVTARSPPPAGPPAEFFHRGEALADMSGAGQKENTPAWPRLCRPVSHRTDRTSADRKRSAGRGAVLAPPR